MTPQESLSFFSSQIERSSKGLEAAHASHNWQLAALNYRQLFKCNLMRALISWRLQQDPTEFICNAISSVAEGITTLRDWSQSPVTEESLPIGKAILISSLIGKKFNAVGTTSGAVSCDSQLDALLATASPTDKKSTSLIADFRKFKRTSLAAETYQNYFDILASEGDSERLNGLTKVGELLFARRVQDSFFTGSDQTEGGGPDNNLVVDYRLAVALKRAGARNSSPHTWIW